MRWFGDISPMHVHWLSLSRTLLLAILFAAPLAFGAVESWAWTTLACVVAIVFLFWCVACVQVACVEVIWTPLYIPGALFCLLGLLQLYTNQTADPIATRNSLLVLVTDLIIFFLAVNLFSQRDPRRPLRNGGEVSPHTHHNVSAPEKVWSHFGWALTTYVLAFSVFALAQFFSDTTRIYWAVESSGSMFGPYVSHNNYAGLMEMLIPLLGVFLLWQLGNHSGQFLVGFALLISIVSVIVSGSRGGVTALVVELAISCILWRSRLSGRHTVALMLLATGTVGLALWWLPHRVLKRFETAVVSPDISYQDRKMMTYDSLRIARDQLTSGSGLGSFETVYPKYQSLATDYKIPYAHNDYAQAFAETGLAGAVTILLAVGLFFTGVARLQLPLRSLDSFFRLGAIVGCCGLLVHSWVDFNLHIPANSAWFAFLAGLTQTVPVNRNSVGS